MKQDIYIVTYPAPSKRISVIETICLASSID